MGKLAEATRAAVTAVGDSRAAVARQLLVDALSTVSGLSAGTAAPDVATPGSAWPRWVQSTYNGRLCSVTADTYDVFAVLPADYLAATVEAGDELRDAIEPALSRVCQLSFSEPVSVQFNDNQTMPGLRFRVTVA